MPDITYAGKSEGDAFDLYHLMADGDSDGQNRRPVLEILVDSDDHIWVAAIPTVYGPLLATLPQQTKGKVHRHTDHELAAAIGEDNATEICLGAVAAYVLPRVATLMARVYCPAKPVDITDEWPK
jgi:hypothetical protein